MQQSSWWEKVKFLINVYKELKKASRPRTVIGFRILAISISCLPFVSWGIIMGFDQIPLLNEIEIAQNQMTLWSALLNSIAFIFGIGLILYDIHLEKNQSRKVARLIINGLPNMQLNFPDNILNTAEKFLAREPVMLSAKSENLDAQVDMYNAESKVNLISRFVTHEGCQKLYVGGLARIPFLIGYGAMLRNISGLSYFDKLHSNGGWRLLDDEDVKIELVYRDEALSPNQKGEIGIALGMSTEVLFEQLPDALKNHTIFIDTTGGVERNKVLNQENLHRLSKTLAEKIDSLSSKSDVKSIHLFLSIQSTLAIEIGRRYQEGTHKDWVIYNYDAKQHCYPWSLRLSGSSLTVESSAD